MQASAKLLAYVGFSIKSRHIVYGYDNVIKARGVRLVLAAESINRTAKKELSQYCEGEKIPLHWCDEEMLQECVHRMGCKCVGLTDASLGHAADMELTRMRREELHE